MQKKAMEVTTVKRILRIHSVPEDELIQMAEGGYFNSSRKGLLGGAFATFISFLIALITCRGLSPYVFATFLVTTLTAAIFSLCLLIMVRSDNRKVKDYVKSLRESREA